MISALSLTLPLLISGLILILCLKLKILNIFNYPIDHFKKINSIRIFGQNKTYKGILVYVIVAPLTCVTLNYILNHGGANIVHPMFAKNPFLIGTIYATSYSTGELLNSFIKRQLKIEPGEITRSRFKHLQVFFDLSDGIILTGVTLFVSSLASFYEIMLAICIGIIFHLATDWVMITLKIKNHH